MLLNVTVEGYWGFKMGQPIRIIGRNLANEIKVVIVGVFSNPSFQNAVDGGIAWVKLSDLQLWCDPNLKIDDIPDLFPDIRKSRLLASQLNNLS